MDHPDSQTDLPASSESAVEAATDPAAAPPHEVLRRLQKSLPVRLTERDELEVSKLKARRERALRKLEKDKADTVSSFGSKIKEAKAEIAKLGDELDAGERVMAVDVEERITTASGSRMIETVRLDTGAVVERRAASLGELQRNLPGTASGGVTNVLGDMDSSGLLAEAEEDDDDDSDADPDSEDDPDEGGQAQFDAERATRKKQERELAAQAKAQESDGTGKRGRGKKAK